MSQADLKKYNAARGEKFFCYSMIKKVSSMDIFAL